MSMGNDRMDMCLVERRFLQIRTVGLDYQLERKTGTRKRTKANMSVVVSGRSADEKKWNTAGSVTSMRW